MKPLNQISVLFSEPREASLRFLMMEVLVMTVTDCIRPFCQSETLLLGWGARRKVFCASRKVFDRCRNSFYGGRIAVDPFSPPSNTTDTVSDGC